MSWLSNCHLILTVTSIPFPFHLHLHLICRSRKKPHGSGACVWTIWIDVKLLTFDTLASRSLFLSISFQFAGELGTLGLTQFNEARSQSGVSGLAIQTYLRFCQISLLLVATGEAKNRHDDHLNFFFQQFQFGTNTGYGDGNCLIPFGSLHWPVPVRFNGSVFARKTKMHSTTEFAMTGLSMCVCARTICKGVKLRYVAGAWQLFP